MPRVTSHKTQQAILVTGEPLDMEGPLPPKLELFDALGEPLALTGAQLYADEGDPDSTLGQVGDFYIDVIANTLWQKRLVVDVETWEQIALLSGTPPSSAAYRGVWNSGITYIPGDTVLRGGDHYGTTEETTGFDPSTVVGSNFGGVVRGIQTLNTHKVLDDVMYTKVLDATSPVNTDGNRVIVIATDTGSAEDRTILIHNRTPESIALRVGVFTGDPNYQSLSGVTGPSNWAAGTSASTIVKWNTFYGGPDGVIHIYGDADTEGEVDITVQGGALTGPPTPNPWDLLSAT